MANALVIVPPFLKYNSGSLLGPALLKAAAAKAGHRCSVVDLNARYILPRAPPRVKHGMFLGDHDKVVGRTTLSDIEHSFLERNLLPYLDTGSADLDEYGTLQRVKFGFLTHDEVRLAAKRASSSQFGDWAREELESHAASRIPDVVGISLLHAGQVIPAATATVIARQLWPNALVAWGGPHISGLATAISVDLPERKFAADTFVTGHAEQTFIDILDSSVESSSSGQTRPCILRGAGMVDAAALAPSFDCLDIYDEPITLPAQSTVGCSYGRCSFCTYPAIEPLPRRLSLSNGVGSIVDHAVRIGAAVSFKDSLVTPRRLDEIAECVAGRVPWSACTKLSYRLDADRLVALEEKGLATLEVGLESLPETQRRMRKVQPRELIHHFLDAMASTSDMSLVVNYMTGFPWENEAESASGLRRAEELVAAYLGSRGRVEHNSFELERLSPMARDSCAYGIDPLSVNEWPWASVLPFRPK